MSVVPIDYVVSFSSEDLRYKADNLLTSEVNKRKQWLCSMSDRSMGSHEIILQLQQVCKISYLDIGNHGCAFIEVWVGRSSWPLSRPFMCLLPAVSFMTLIDSKLGKNISGMRMFDEENFDSESRSQSWDRLKIVCKQPFTKDKQFGLSLVAVKSTTEGIQKTPKATPAWKQESPKQIKTTAEIQRHFFKGSLPYIEDKPVDKHFSKEKPQSFEDKVIEFFTKLDPKIIDIETLTMADLRHKLEKEMYRKLSKEEKKYFFAAGEAFLETTFEDKSVEENQRLVNTTPDPSITKEKSSLEAAGDNDGFLDILSNRNRHKTPRRSFLGSRGSSSTPSGSNVTSSMNGKQSSPSSNTMNTIESKLSFTPRTLKNTTDQKGFGSAKRGMTEILDNSMLGHTPPSQKGTSGTHKRESGRGFQGKQSYSPGMPLSQLNSPDVWLTKGQRRTQKRKVSQLSPVQLNSTDVKATSPITPTVANSVNKKRRSLPITITGISQMTPRGYSAKSNIIKSLSYSTPAKKAALNETQANSIPPNLLRCSSCSGLFPTYAIDVHRISCLRKSSTSTSASSKIHQQHSLVPTSPTSYNRPYESINKYSKNSATVSVDRMPCPLCGKQYLANEIELHANMCADLGTNSGWSSQNPILI